jgi:hypothetical protein
MCSCISAHQLAEPRACVGSVLQAVYFGQYVLNQQLIVKLQKPRSPGHWIVELMTGGSGSNRTLMR